MSPAARPTEGTTKGIARGYGKDSPGDSVLSSLPLGEVTPTEDVAEVITFLASGRSRHTTGATIDITGADYVR